MSPASLWLTGRCFLRVFAIVGAFGLCFLAVDASTRTGSPDDTSSPIFGVKVPDGYRQWELIAVSQGNSALNSIHGNEVSLKAYRDGKLPFPNGSILVKLSWERKPLAGFDGAFVTGAPTMVQVMVKDSKRYADTGGWGFGRFIDGKPADVAQHKTCFACHSRNMDVREHDFVFTRRAP